MNRQESNKKLVQLLNDLVLIYSDQRFSQILLNFGFIVLEQHNPIDLKNYVKDEYFIESEEILTRVRNIVRSIYGDKNEN